MNKSNNDPYKDFRDSLPVEYAAQILYDYFKWYQEKNKEKRS